jgi:hypothetical protein
VALVERQQVASAVAIRQDEDGRIG